MLNAMSEDSKVSRDLKPSPELLSLLSAAATGMLAFGELWDTIKTKGAAEGFDEQQLLSLFAPMVKDRFTEAQMRYLMNKEKEKERAKQNRLKQKEELKSLRTYTDIPPKKELEQFKPKIHETVPELKNVTDQQIAEAAGIEIDEEPTPLELAEIKIKQLEDALKKTEQFKPASVLQPPPPPPPEIDIVNNIVVRCGIEKIEALVHNEMAGMRNRGWKTVEVTMRAL